MATRISRFCPPDTVTAATPDTLLKRSLMRLSAKSRNSYGGRLPDMARYIVGCDWVSSLLMIGRSASGGSKSTAAFTFACTSI
jgi:hypothetical protein